MTVIDKRYQDFLRVYANMLLIQHQMEMVVDTDFQDQFAEKFGSTQAKIDAFLDRFESDKTLSGNPRSAEAQDFLKASCEFLAQEVVKLLEDITKDENTPT